MKKKRFILGSLIILLGIQVNAIALEVVGEGIGESALESRNQALSALSESIFVEIQSEFNLLQDNNGKTLANKKIRSRSELPILGAKIETKKRWRGGYYSRAILNSKRSSQLYQHKLNDLHKNILHDLNNSQEKKLDANSKYELLSGLQAKLDQYSKLSHVAVMLGLKLQHELPTSKAQIKSIISKLETEAASISQAAETLTKAIGQKNIYLYPPSYQNSHEITPLARLIRDHMTKHLSTTDYHQDAQYHYKGNYVQDKTGLYITYKLLDKYGNTQSFRSVNLLPEAYEGIEYKTKTATFDQLLHQGYVVKSDFKVDINTSHGREALLFEENASLEILVKLNQPGYYYIIGHTLNDEIKMSYLLELVESVGKRKLVRYVNPDEVNKWISLGEFNVAAPFGVESLQVIASNKDLINQLPDYTLNPANEYYVISDNPINSVVKVRGIKLKKSKKAKTSEAVLMFTTTQGR